MKYFVYWDEYKNNPILKIDKKNHIPEEKKERIICGVKKITPNCYMINESSYLVWDSKLQSFIKTNLDLLNDFDRKNIFNIFTIEDFLLRIYDYRKINILPGDMTPEDFAKIIKNEINMSHSSEHLTVHNVYLNKNIMLIFIFDSISFEVIKVKNNSITDRVVIERNPNVLLDLLEISNKSNNLIIKENEKNIKILIEHLYLKIDKENYLFEYKILPLKLNVLKDTVLNYL